MVSFRAKKIDQILTLGERLRQRRKEFGFDLNQAAQKTQIPKKYLTALESGDYAILPGEIYIKSFLRIYTNLLNLPEKVFLDLYKAESIFTKRLLVCSRTLNKPRLIITSRLIRHCLIALVVLICLGYLGVKVYKIVAPPLLVVVQPENNLVTIETSVAVKGQSEPEARVTINNKEIFLDQRGYFNELIDLQGGLNNIRIAAERRHSREKVVYRQVMVRENKLSVNNF